MYADVDNGTETINKKIRNGEIAQYNFILGTSYIQLDLLQIVNVCGHPFSGW